MNSNSHSQSEVSRISITIIELANKDQAMRTKAVQDANQWDSRLDIVNTHKFKKLLNQYGWPKLSLFSVEVCRSAWLLAQHADEDIKFQKQCLSMMKSLPQKEVLLWTTAMLEDRILVSEGKEQIFGSQFHKDSKTGMLVPWPIANPEELDLRRAKVGLNAFADELQIIQKFAKAKPARP